MRTEAIVIGIVLLILVSGMAFGTFSIPVAQLSRSESIPLEELVGHVKQKEEEKQRIELEIEQENALIGYALK